jgi:hypothetical protein
MDIFDSPIDPDLRHPYITEVAAEFSDMIESGTGKIIFISGGPNTGKTVLAGQCISELSRSTPHPMMLVGGFGNAGHPGGFSGSLLPDHKMDTASVLGALGQALSVAAAAAATFPDPSGPMQLGISIGAFIGQAAQASAMVADSFGVVGGERPSSNQSAGPDELIYAIRKLMETRRPIVVCLDDLQLADPQLYWYRLFLRRLIRPLLTQYPLMLIVTSEVEPPATFVTTERTQVICELEDDGIAVELDLNPLTSADIDTWLNRIDPSLSADLLAVSGGHPGWLVKIFKDWNTKNYIERSELIGLWRYSANGRDLAMESVNDFVNLAIWRLASEEADRYEKLYSILEAAALEGTIFTADALAITLSYDRDELVDLIDEELTSESVGDSAPLEDYGVIKLDNQDDEQTKRYLCRYRFRSNVFWSALRREHAIGPRGHQSTIAQLAGSYAEALIHIYSADLWLAARRIAALLSQAGRYDAAEFYRQLWELRGSMKLHRAVLLDDLATFNQAVNSNQAMNVWQALTMARRALRASSALEGTCRQAEDLQGYGLVFSLSDAITKKVPAARQQAHRLRALGLAGLGRLEFTDGRYGEAACYSKLAADSLSVSGEPASQTSALLLCAAALVSCVVFLDPQNNPDLYDKGVGYSHYPRLAAPDQLWFIPEDRPRRPSQAEVYDAAEDMINAARETIPKTSPAVRQHLLGQLLTVSARLKTAVKDSAAAYRFLRQAIEVLPSRDQKCVEAWILLAENLLLQKRYSEAEEASWRGLRGCVLNQRYKRATGPLQSLAFVQLGTQRESDAVKTFAHLINLSVQQHEIARAALAWRYVGEIYSGKGELARDVLLCFAMAEAAPGLIKNHEDTELVDRAKELGQTESQRMMLLEQAVETWRRDSGRSLLDRLSGIKISDTMNFLAMQGLTGDSRMAEDGGGDG